MFGQETNEEPLVVVVSSLLLLDRANQLRKPRKKPRVWVRPYLTRRQSQGQGLNLLQELRFEDPDFYRRFLRMSVSTFTYLMELVDPIIRKQDTRFRNSISTSEMLAITLRYLATGESQWSLGLQFRVGQPTISKFIPKVCEAIYNSLRRIYLKTPSTEGEWREIAAGFEKSWNFPHCIGALDGKHVEIQQPPNSASEYFNYKKYYSVVLMALVDSDLKFIYVDVGAPGRLSDGGIWAKCSLRTAMNNSELGIPASDRFEGFKEKLPYVIVGDEAFPLGENLMRPFPGLSLSIPKRVFNYRLSRARRTSENVFGILASQFRILRTPITAKIETIDSLLLTICCLHNLLRTKDSRAYTPSGLTDNEDISTGSISLGEWRNNPSNNMQSISAAPPQRPSVNAVQVREKFMEYFNTVGSVNWQLRSIAK